jgi:acetyl/propionyl-CoA carboxylase alpha subunit
MREALNGFVIRGVASNIPFQAALLAHPKFVAGDFNTGFIAEHYGKGFRAEDVPHDDPDFLVALAAGVYRRYRERAAGISGQLDGHGVRIGTDFVVVVKGEGGAHRHVPVKVDAQRRHACHVAGQGLHHRQGLELRRHPRHRHLQRPAVHRADRAPGPVVPRGAQRPPHRGHGDERARRRAAARDALQGAGRHEQVPALADARAAGRRGRAAGPGRCRPASAWPSSRR